MALALVRSPVRTVSGAAAAAIVVGIFVNALALQGGPHPAPFFHHAAEPQAPVAAPLPPLRPAESVAAAEETAPVIKSRPAAPQPAAPTTSAAQPASPPMPVSRDAIGEMLRTPQATVAGDKAVLAAQRALNRLGYGPIKPDGIFGAGTRQAIEKFERDRKLPVTGEVNPRTAKELATASGLAD